MRFDPIKRLESLSLAELLDIRAKIEPIITAKKAKAAAEVKVIITKMAQDAGYSLDEVFGNSKTKPERAAKYRNPKTGETWAGRGRPPHWMPKYKAIWPKVAIKASESTSISAGR